MPISISSAKFSFVRFEAVEYTLPAFRQFDSGFQFVVDGYYEIDRRLYMGVTDMSGQKINAFAEIVSASIIAYKYRIPAAITMASSIFLYKVSSGDIEVNYNKAVSYNQLKAILANDFGYSVGFSNSFLSKSLSEIIISYSSTAVSQKIDITLQYYWGMGYVRANSDLIGSFVKVNNCFKYSINDDLANVVGMTNNFKVMRSDKFTTLTYYSNNEDEFGFIYNGDNLNVVRLPYFLSRPQYKEQRSIMLKSSGSHKLLSSQLEKLYELRTEFINADLHEFMRIMLSHDNIIVDSSFLKGSPLQIVNSDDYNPSWEDESEYELAQARTNVFAGDFGYTNDNLEQIEIGCQTPIFNVDNMGDNTASLTFQVPAGLTKLLLNYKKTGTAIWMLAEITPVSEYTISGLTQATDYDFRAAGKCGEEVGSFGRIKSAKTTGVELCVSLSNLVFTGKADAVFSFQVDLPDPEPGDIEVLIIRPDGTTYSQAYPTTGFVVNPFVFSLDLGSTRQFGNYGFRARSICSPGNQSPYTAENIQSYQDVPQTASVQYSFNVMFDADGTFDLYVNNISYEHSNTSVNGFKQVNKDDQIRVALRSRTANSSIQVYDQDTQALIYDSGPYYYQAEFTFSAEAGKKYYIDANVTT